MLDYEMMPQWYKEWGKEHESSEPNGVFSFIVSDLERTKKSIVELNEILNRCGIKFKVNTEYECPVMTVAIDYDTYCRVTCRRSGKKKNYRKAEKYRLDPTVGEVIKMRETMTQAKIIETIGCPKATYYRTWKILQANPEVYDENEKFFEIIEYHN